MANLEYPPYPHIHAYCPECRRVTEWLAHSSSRVTSIYCQPCGRQESYYWDDYPTVKNEQDILAIFHKHSRRCEYATTS